MHRTQILLEDEQYEELKRESLATGESLSTTIRVCVEQRLVCARQDPLLDLFGRIERASDTAPSDLGERHDHYRYTEKS